MTEKPALGILQTCTGLNCSSLPAGCMQGSSGEISTRSNKPLGPDSTNHSFLQHNSCSGFLPNLHCTQHKGFSRHNLTSVQYTISFHTHTRPLEPTCTVLRGSSTGSWLQKSAPALHVPCVCVQCSAQLLLTGTCTGSLETKQRVSSDESLAIITQG